MKLRHSPFSASRTGLALLPLSLLALAGCQVDSQAPSETNAPQVLEVQQMPKAWWQDAVFYEIWPRSFKDSDGDGHGDFKGMTSKLDYLVDLGVDGIWLTPIFEAPSYHGYDFQDFFAVEQDYGSMADFDEFLAEAHARDIRVILDLVINHISNEHPWFIASAQREPVYDDYFIWSSELPENYGHAWSDELNPGAVWHWNETRGEYYYAAFGASQPDINLENPEVISEINNLATFWLEKGVDGFRLDAVRYALEEERPAPERAAQADTAGTIAYWTQFTAHVKSIKPDALLVAEAWADMPTVGRYHDNGNGLDSAFDFDFGYVIVELLNDGERVADFGTVDTGPRASGRDALWENLLERNANAPMAFYAPFLTNHDQTRVMYSLGDDPAKARIAASLLFTTPGSIYIYYGEEIGLSQPLTGHDVYKRAIMPWDNSPSAGFNDTATFWLDEGRWTPSIEGFSPWWSPWWEQQRGSGAASVASQLQDPDSLVHHYRNLIAARRAAPELALPEVLRYHPLDNPNVWALEAVRDGSSVIVLINLDSSAPASTSLPSSLQGDYRELISGNSSSIGASLSLPPAATMILRAD